MSKIGYSEDGDLFIWSDSGQLIWPKDARVDVIATPPPAPENAPAEVAPSTPVPPQSAPPVASPPGSTQQPTKSKKGRWIKPPPGVMAIVQAPSDSTTGPLKWSFLDLDRFQPGLRAPQFKLHATIPAELHRHLVPRLQHLGVTSGDRFVTVEVRASLLQKHGPLDLSGLEALIKDKTLGLAGIRLVFTTDPDPKP
jgi:hypothetical protein